jgi:hypothetical protein
MSWLHTALGRDPIRRSENAASAWATSGCLALSGEPNNEFGDQSGRAAAVLANGLTDLIETFSLSAGQPVSLNGAELLAERAATAHATRGGQISCNRMTRMIPTSDGWVSLSLSRASDVESLEACFEASLTDEVDPWGFVAQQSARRTSADVLFRAQLLGLSCAIPSEQLALGLPTEELTAADQSWSLPSGRATPLVVDTSSLWAGPLCAHVLAASGATVIKVEDVNRPDGARKGAGSFFDLLHSGSQMVGLDMRTDRGINCLHRLLAMADVVITSARPRAFHQFGVDPKTIWRSNPIAAWIAISAFGPSAPMRIGFGDDAAIAAGLHGGSTDRPTFCADAIADPLTGLASAAIALHALATTKRVFAEVSLVGVALLAAAADPGLPLTLDQTRQRSTSPIARIPAAQAASIGAHTSSWC